MQNKGAIRIFAILLGLACIFYLSFSWITRKIESDARTAAQTIASSPATIELAKNFAAGDTAAERMFLDSIREKAEYRYLDSVRKLKVDVFPYKYIFTYEDCKEHEINLGLDLKGGMNVTLEVSVADIIRNMSAKPDDANLKLALDKARALHIKQKRHFADIFAEELKKIDPGAPLANYFRSSEMGDKITFDTPDDKIIEMIKERVDESIATSEKTLRARVDKFGVTQPNIQKLEASGRLLIELPGVKDKKRVRKYITESANLEFWETYNFEEIAEKLQAADNRLSEILAAARKDTAAVPSDTAKANAGALVKTSDTLKKKDTTSVLSQLGSANDTAKTSALSSDQDSIEAEKNKYPLFRILLQGDASGKFLFEMKGPVVGFSYYKDTAKVMEYLSMDKVKRLLPDNLKFAWTLKPPPPIGDDAPVVGLVALKATGRNKKPALYGDIITDASKEYDQKGGGTPHISMTMNDEAAQTWANITADNAPVGDKPGRSIAIVLDGIVYSYPTVQGRIPGGRSQITGNFDDHEANDLVNILKAGKMPARTTIVEETIVGPTLGQESIESGFRSFIIALCVIFIFMIFYYNRAGIVADIVLLLNIFFIVGVLASLGAVLTLPGIAGIVLVMGMAVDANILIYERVREEIRQGKGIQLAIADGYRHAMSSILDSNITTILLGIVLYAYGSGPVQGFATTLIIGILCSMFCAIFISRLIFEWMLDRKMDISFSIPFTANAFRGINIDFVGKRKLYYIVSSIVILAGVFFFFKNGGFTMGVDFKGGRSYIVRFEQPVKTEEVTNSLKNVFGTQSGDQVKTFGEENQVRITTAYMIDDTSSNAEQIVEQKLKDALSTIDNKSEIVQSQKVGSTISRDLRNNAVWTVILGCVMIFIYILIRFKGWQYGMGALISLIHDVAVVLALFTILDGVLPFTLEVNQDFIAAVLTVIGYSINDTIIVFDRIREYLAEKSKKKLEPGEEKNRIINMALNSTLSRTLMTSGTTIFVLIAMFIFGGEVLRSFIFALLAGIAVGTYSSLCISTPIVVDFDGKKKAAVQ